MRKVFLSIAAIIGCGLLTSCGMGTTGTTTNTPQQTNQPTGGEILGAVANKVLGNAGQGSVLGEIISTFGGGILTSQSSLIGTWNYSQPCVQFESESLLAKAGGSIISQKVEAKLNEYYQKVGIKQGACKFVFAKDNTLQYTIGSKTLKGKYSFDSTKKIVTITTQSGANVSAYVSITGNNMGLTFDASKLLTLLNSAASATSQLSGLSSVASNYTGMKLGFEFTR